MSGCFITSGHFSRVKHADFLQIPYPSICLIDHTQMGEFHTIKRYMRKVRKRNSGQNWVTFLKNHAGVIWACNFTTIHTLFFKPIYILVFMELQTRKIVHTAVTLSPTDDWSAQQLREATAWGKVQQPGESISCILTVFVGGQVGDAITNRTSAGGTDDDGYPVSDINELTIHIVHTVDGIYNLFMPFIGTRD